MVQEVPLGEITFRKYEKPYESTQRDLIRKTCLSLGLLQPGDSRDIIVDIFLVLNESRRKKTWLSSFEIKEMVEKLRKENSLEIKGLAESNIRRQLKRLRDMMLVDKQDNKYRISEFETISFLFEKNIEKFLLPQIIDRVKDYLKMLEK